MIRAIVRYGRAIRKTLPVSLTLTRIDHYAASPQRKRASVLKAALARSRTDCVAWVDPAYGLTNETLSSLCDAFAASDVGAVTFAGLGRRLTLLGVPSAEGAPRSQVPDAVLYAPAGVAVLHRQRVLDAGGIDDSLVFGHEDADLGWRLALRGLRTVEVRAAAPRGVETSGVPVGDRMLAATHLRHVTANQLATLFVCAGDAWLRTALPCALARIIGLAAADAGLQPSQFDFGRPLADRLSLPVESIARLLALDDLVRHFPALRQRRAREQAARIASDATLIATLFDDALDSAWMDIAGDGARALVRMLGVGTPTSVCLAATVFANASPDDANNPSGAVAAPPRVRLADKGPTLAGDAPRVSIIVLTASGPTHLPDCLTSLAALDYPPDAVEVIVVDNGSREDPAATVTRHYPRARVVRNDHNLGFCGGNNTGAAAASHEWLFFLNDDTRADPRLLRELFATAARRHALSVAAFVVDWTGTEVDYAGGSVNFEARGFQHGIGSSHLAHWQHEHPVAFANGAAMLIRRDVYFAAGGFPDPYFAYYEDVALGWALWLLGHEVWLCPEGVVYHRHHGTSALSTNAARLRNCERNALFTVLTHTSEEGLSDLVSANLLLAAERVVMGAGLGGTVDDQLAFENDHQLPLGERLDPRLYVRHLRAELRRSGARREHGALGSLSRVGIGGATAACRSLFRLARTGSPLPKAGAITERIDVPSDWVATLAGAAEWAARAHEMETRRKSLQQSRCVDDQAVASLSAESWLNAIPAEPERQGEYERAHRAVVDQFGLERLLNELRT